jgi:probable aminopeptidase NPEPL1
MPTHTRITLLDRDHSPPVGACNLIFGRRAALHTSEWREKFGISAETWAAMLNATPGGDSGACTSTWIDDKQVLIGVLPEACSRHNSPTRAWAIPDLVRRVRPRGDALIIGLIEDEAHAPAVAMAVARALPLYQQSSGARSERVVRLGLFGPNGLVDDPSLQHGIDAVRDAARLGDMPTLELGPSALVMEARAVAQALGVSIEVIEGEALRDQGFGGLWHVGKAARQPPALVALRWRPEGARRHVAWVGKGIVYDTGGLSIKAKTAMPSMKGDMAGAAAVLYAFRAAVLARPDFSITAVLCIAENAVGPDALRPDDIITLRSGRTVEVNNTDAEGRLVLADGVYWVSKTESPDLVIDIATLTGAVLQSTGKVHAGVVSNTEIVEIAATRAGLISGETCFPLLYAPELLRKEFKSVVADMKNSVKDRNNSQSSCAAIFVAAHLPDPAPPWLHIDIAGTAWDGERRLTGWGVGLLLALGAGPGPGE